MREHSTRSTNAWEYQTRVAVIYIYTFILHSYRTFEPYSVLYIIHAAQWHCAYSLKMWIYCYTLLLHSQFTLEIANGVQLYEFTTYHLPFALAANPACLQNYEQEKEEIIIIFAIPNSFVRQSNLRKDRDIKYSTTATKVWLRVKKERKEIRIKLKCDSLPKSHRIPFTVHLYSFILAPL